MERQAIYDAVSELEGAVITLEEIQNVPGIKNAVFQNIKDHITVDS